MLASVQSLFACDKHLMSGLSHGEAGRWQLASGYQKISMVPTNGMGPSSDEVSE